MGKQIKATKKVKSEKKNKLKQLISEIKNLKPLASQYYVVDVHFYKQASKHFTITTNNQQKNTDELLHISLAKEVVYGHAFSDVSTSLSQGSLIKNYNVSDMMEFKQNQKSMFVKNINRKIYNKRSGGFFPYSHTISNEYVENVLQDLQIYKEGTIPTDPDVCFIAAIRGQIPADIIEKLKFEIRTEYVSLMTIKKVCEKNNIFIKIRLSRETSHAQLVRYGKEDSEFKADICCLDKHYFKYIEQTGVTSYYIKNYDKLKDREDGHVFYKLNKRTKDRFINSFMLVTELLKQKEKLLVSASYELISQFKSIKMDVEKIYDFNASLCSRPISNDVKISSGIKRIIFDCETYTNKRKKHIPYLLSCIDSDNVSKTFIGKNCMDSFLTYLSEKYGSVDYKNAIKLELYAHNSTYDGSFMINKLMQLKIVEKDSRYVSLQGVYCSWNVNKKFVNLLVKDSYRLIPMKLSEIPEACGFKDQAMKEVMYYNMYNHNTIDNITKMHEKIL